MIVNIRGMSGSGKSTAVKNIMAEFPTITPMGKFKNKTLYYKCSNHTHCNDLIVLGAYESEHGAKGADLIDNSNRVFTLIKHFNDMKYNVLFESFMYSISNSIIKQCFNDNIQCLVLKLSVDEKKVAEQRKQRAINAGKSGNFSKNDFRTNPKLFEKSFNDLDNFSNTKKIVVQQDNVVKTFFDQLYVDEKTNIVDNTDLFELQCRVAYTLSKRKENIKLDLFDFK